MNDEQPAHTLTKGVPYVRGWARAARAAAALKHELNACGLPTALPYLKADVNALGVGTVELGRITPQTAETLAALLAKTRTGPDTETSNAGSTDRAGLHCGAWASPSKE